MAAASKQARTQKLHKNHTTPFTNQIANEKKGCKNKSKQKN